MHISIYIASMFEPKSFSSSTDIESDIETILLTAIDNVNTVFDKSFETFSPSLRNFIILYCIRMKVSIPMFDLITDSTLVLYQNQKF